MKAKPLGDVTEAATSSLKPYSRNPRIIPERAITVVADSIKEFGWQQPIVIDNNNEIIAGHTRWLAAKKLGLETVPTVKAHNLTPEQVKAYRIADNRASDFSSWDFPELSTQLEELADNFSDVLQLADWQTIQTEYSHAMAEHKTSSPPPAVSNPAEEHSEPGDENPDTGLALDVPDTIEAYTSGDYCLTVVTGTENDRNHAASIIIDIPGVLDVRNKR